MDRVRHCEDLGSCSALEGRDQRRDRIFLEF